MSKQVWVNTVLDAGFFSGKCEISGEIIKAGIALRCLEYVFALVFVLFEPLEHVAGEADFTFTIIFRDSEPNTFSLKINIPPFYQASFLETTTGGDKKVT